MAVHIRDMAIEIAPLTGPALSAALDDLARLRITVFRDYPYLYDGTREYEFGYLTKFMEAKDAILVAARDGDRIIGCATGSALAAHHEQFAEPFRARDYDLNEIFYCGESVLLGHYRGQGLGHAFFDQREAHARERGYKYTTFCGVVRPADHPLRPADYRPLDLFWEKRGYRKQEGLVAQFEWKDVDHDRPTSKPMQFWMRAL